MKKECLIILLFLFILIGCSNKNNNIIKVNDNAEITMTNLLKSIDEQEEYKTIYRELKYEANNKHYNYIYNYKNSSFNSSDKSIIISKEESVYENGEYEHYKYEFIEFRINKIIHCIYDDPQHYNVLMYEETELISNEKENYHNFMEKYFVNEYTKYNIDLLHTSNYIEVFNKIQGISEKTYVRTFMFPEDSIYEFNVLDNSVTISQCLLKYNTYYNSVSKTYSTNSHISFIGYNEDIEYTIFIYIN